MNCQHGVNLKHRRCYHCEDIAAAESRRQISRVVAPERAKAIVREQQALEQAGAAIDRALTQVVTYGRINMNNALLIDEMHKALNAIVALTGKPWRDKE